MLLEVGKREGEGLTEDKAFPPFSQDTSTPKKKLKSHPVNIEQSQNSNPYTSEEKCTRNENDSCFDKTFEGNLTQIECLLEKNDRDQNDKDEDESTNDETVYVINLAQDDRPYCEVKIFGSRKSGLLDSGASVTVIAECPDLKEHTAHMTNTSVSLKSANGGFLDVVGCVPLPIQYLRKTVMINTIVVKELAHELILGVDFWQAVGFKIIDEEGFTINAIDQPPTVQVKTEIELQERDLKEFQIIIQGFPVAPETTLPRTPVIEHVIELKPDAKPFVLRPYLYSPYVEDKMKVELDRMIKLGIIEPSSSPVSSPVVPATKKDGTVRICLDSRRLNGISSRCQIQTIYLRE